MGPFSFQWDFQLIFQSGVKTDRLEIEMNSVTSKTLIAIALVAAAFSAIAVFGMGSDDIDADVYTVTADVTNMSIQGNEYYYDQYDYYQALLVPDTGYVLPDMNDMVITAGGERLEPKEDYNIRGKNNNELYVNRWAITGNLHIVIHAVAKQYEVKLDNQGADSGPTSITTTFNSNSFAPIDAPTKTGYKFLGYSTQANGGRFLISPGFGKISSFDNISVPGILDSGKWIVDSGTTLYAKWETWNTVLSIDTYSSKTVSQGITNVNVPVCGKISAGSSILVIEGTEYRAKCIAGFEVKGWTITKTFDGSIYTGDTVPNFKITAKPNIVMTKDSGKEVSPGIKYCISNDTLFLECSSLDASLPDFTQYGPWYSQKEGIKKIDVGTGFVALGDNAFRGLDGVTSVSLPDTLRSIGHAAFSDCGSLKMIAIPSSVTSIGSYAFYDCKYLSNVSFPDGVREIGESAFRGCSSIVMLQMPGKLTTIGSNAFMGCSSLTMIKFEGELNKVSGDAFPDHAFFSADGKALEVNANNLAGTMFIGKDIKHMTADNTPQGDDGDSTVQMYSVIAILIILGIGMLAMETRRQL